MTDRFRPHRAAVLGSPIHHSLSPVLHNAAYAHLGLPWDYAAHDVPEDQLPGFVSQLDDSWAGLSLTMPLKRAVLPLLTSVSAPATDVQAANTVLVGPGGTLTGDNTDIPGMVAALAEAGVEKVERPVLLGAGATAGSALAALHRCGAGHVRVVARSAARAAEVRSIAMRLGMTLEMLPWGGTGEWADADLVIATTPAGATDDLLPLLPASPGGVLFDVLYAPWPTGLADTWSRCGGQVISGFELLIHQAVLQVELMTARTCGSLDRVAVLRAMRRALAAAHEGYSRTPDRPM